MLTTGAVFSQDSVILSGDKPIIFTSIGNSLYDQSAIYNNTANGFLIDLAKISNNVDSDPIDFKINARGGTHDFLTIVGNSGNVGIGTTSPQADLDILSNDASLFVRDPRDSTEADATLRLQAGGQVQRLKFLWNDRFTIDSGSGSAEQFTIKRNGNVGIGITSPNNKLEVKGTIRAEEIIVETGWSDFVFEDSYRLRPLHEIENHIEEHGHLPDVPPASVVESQGLSIGEAQKIMMQKIEELTLYVIELKKENEAQQREIERLKSN